MATPHAAGWEPGAPSPAQLKEFFSQIESGKMNKTRLQAMLNGPCTYEEWVEAVEREPYYVNMTPHELWWYDETRECKLVLCPYTRDGAYVSELSFVWRTVRFANGAEVRVDGVVEVSHNLLPIQAGTILIVPGTVAEKVRHVRPTFDLLVPAGLTQTGGNVATFTHFETV